MTKKRTVADERAAIKTEPTPLEAFKLTRLVVHSGNYDYYRHHIAGEPGGGASVTVPGSNMSLEEILLRFSQGYPIDGHLRPADYTEDEYIPNFKAMDLAEIQQWREDLFHQQQTLIQSLDAATRELAIRDGILPRNINELYPLPEEPKQPAEPPSPPHDAPAGA